MLAALAAASPVLLIVWALVIAFTVVAAVAYVRIALSDPTVPTATTTEK